MQMGITRQRLFYGHPQDPKNGVDCKRLQKEL